MDLVVGDDEDDAPAAEVDEVLVDEDLLGRGLDAGEGLNIEYLRNLYVRVVQQGLREVDSRNVLKTESRDQTRSIQTEIPRVDQSAAGREPRLGDQLDLRHQREALPGVEGHLAQNLAAPHAQLHLERYFQLNYRPGLKLTEQRVPRQSRRDLRDLRQHRNHDQAVKLLERAKHQVRRQQDLRDRVEVVLGQRLFQKVLFLHPLGVRARELCDELRVRHRTRLPRVQVAQKVIQRPPQPLADQRQLSCVHQRRQSVSSHVLHCQRPVLVLVQQQRPQ